MGQPRWDAATAARVETILSAPREGFGSPNFAVLKALFYQTVAAERRENETQGQQRLVYRCIHRDLVADEGAARRLGMEVYDSYTPGVGSEGGASELLGRFKQAVSASGEQTQAELPKTERSERRTNARMRTNSDETACSLNSLFTRGPLELIVHTRAPCSHRVCVD